MRAVATLRQPGGDGDVDASLSAKAAAGDRAAFDELYRRHVDAVWRRLRRLVGPGADAEDLVQQAFWALHRALPSFRGEAAFTTFLYRIVVRVAFDHLRRNRRRPVSPLGDEDLELVAPGPSPETMVLERRELLRALSLLERLKPKKRIAWVLRVVDGMSLEEIAQLTGASAAAVGQQVKYAQKELHALMEARR